MVRRPWILAAAVVVCAAGDSLARIGETFDECTERYGKHVRISNDGRVYVFESGRFRIFVEFSDGKADELSYKKVPPDKDYVGAPLQLTTNEIHTLLQNNFGGEKWETKHPDLYTIDYEDPAKEWTATYSTLTGRLILLTKTAAERVARERQQAEESAEVDPGLEGL